MRRIHIVGVSTRTGTTLLVECMRECFKIDLSEEVETPLSKLRNTRGVYLTKNPGDVTRVHLRLALDPRLYVLCMMRDPRDVIISRHKRDNRYYHASLKTWKEGYASIKRNIGHPRFLVIKFEELITEPNAVQQQIADFLPFLQATKPFGDWHTTRSVSDRNVTALNGVRAFGGENKSKWPQHMDRIRKQVEHFGPLTDDLIQLGYETDREWMSRASADQEVGEQALEKGEKTSLKKRFLRRKHDFVDYPISALAAAVCSSLSLNYG